MRIVKDKATGKHTYILSDEDLTKKEAAMYVIKDEITGKYWTGAANNSPRYYTDNLQEAYAFHEKDLFELQRGQKLVRVEYVLKEVEND